MRTTLLLRKLFLFYLFFLTISVTAQGDATYNWTGGTNTDFYTASNWTSTSGGVLFDNNGFKVVRVSSTSNSPVINSFIDWQPGIFDNLDGVNLTVNADFNVFFNDFLNGTVTVNSGANFTCRNIFRVGREGKGVINVDGGVFRANDPANWQAIFIGVLQNGDGIVNVNNGGSIEGGYHVEVGSRDHYPLGELNVNTGGVSSAYWATVIGPNGTINVNGGTINAGKSLIVGDLYVDTAGTEGALTLTPNTGDLNLNSGTVIVNQNSLDKPEFIVHTDAQILVDEGSLELINPGYNYTADINAMVTSGQIVPATGKKITINYDGTKTTVTAEDILSVSDNNLEKAFKIFPNPTNGSINLKSLNNNAFDAQLIIYNMLGHKVWTAQLTSTSGMQKINIGEKLTSGVYIIQISTDNNLKFTTKISIK
ncbi:T9SS type A sorting domain-containing protein [Tamlana sp. I1]|uniref:T9SS type A sorting domain-containing protein n=1 Tax=Tamlana sp. I1 TaxID=2762061 RepID=UPI0018905DE1|nr:T9SS type A sorting domain-containing protein [Tamlana sp. I1]